MLVDLGAENGQNRRREGFKSGVSAEMGRNWRRGSLVGIGGASRVEGVGDRCTEN